MRDLIRLDKVKEVKQKTEGVTFTFKNGGTRFISGEAAWGFWEGWIKYRNGDGR